MKQKPTKLIRIIKTITENDTIHNPFYFEVDKYRENSDSTIKITCDKSSNVRSALATRSYLIFAYSPNKMVMSQPALRDMEKRRLPLRDSDLLLIKGLWLCKIQHCSPS